MTEAIQKDSKQLKVLIIETGNCHFEIIPSWVYYFNECGFKVYLKCTKMNIKNIFPILKRLNLGFENVNTVKLELYDVVINNTFYPFQKILNIPNTDNTHVKASVVHLISPFVDKNIKHTKHVLITLAKHMNNAAKKFTTQTMNLYPIYFKSLLNIPKRTVSRKKIFIVQGNFDTKRRNYATLIKTIKLLKNRDDFKVIMMGSSGSGLTQIKNMLGQGFEDKVQFEINLNYENFFDKLWTSHFILPLVDTNSSVNNAYFTTKITSSVMLGVGHLLPIICDKKIESIYELENNKNCMCYTSEEDFKKSIIQAINTDQTDYDNMVKEVRKVRDSWMTISKQNIMKWFNK